jgi:transcriptional regulator with XRE-family HTH domain
MLTRLRVARLQRGWTQLQLTARSGVHNADISKIETGRSRPYPRQAQALGAALGLDPACLQDEVAL